MVAPARLHRYLYEDYLLLEQHSQVRHEFLDGEIYAMAGGTPEHAALAASVLRHIGNQLPAGCRTYTSDLRIRISKSDLTTYPDGAVICGKVIPAVEDPLAATNPKLLLEVTSPSTEAYDRGAKLEHYRGLEALREIVVVSHQERRVELHRRGVDGTWSVVAATGGQTIELESLGAKLDVSEIYKALD
ncbi:MAG: Uma2 family endonuclease [Archangium sp.]|nr:Uma2 family endonuclease [Archangium sp.]MDP3574230.1 Uma2 family endonuclease [Archangium sp.]